MRTHTLAQAEVVGHLNRQFVIAWSDLLPALYGSADPSAPPPPAYDPRRIESLPEGAGGGNIRIYFCTATGRIVHQSVGYWKHDRFMDEVSFAEELLSCSDGVRSAKDRCR